MSAQRPKTGTSRSRRRTTNQHNQININQSTQTPHKADALVDQLAQRSGVDKDNVLRLLPLVKSSFRFRECPALGCSYQYTPHQMTNVNGHDPVYKDRYLVNSHWFNHTASCIHIYDMDSIVELNPLTVSDQAYLFRQVLSWLRTIQFDMSPPIPNDKVLFRRRGRDIFTPEHKVSTATGINEQLKVIYDHVDVIDSSTSRLVQQMISIRDQLQDNVHQLSWKSGVSGTLDVNDQ